MGPDDAVSADIERLLREPLILLIAVRGNAHERRDIGRDRALIGDLLAIEHVLKTVAQRADVPNIMLHLEDDAVVFGLARRQRRIDIGRTERTEAGLALLEATDHPIETRNLGHFISSRRKANRLARIVAEGKHRS